MIIVTIVLTLNSRQGTVELCEYYAIKAYQVAE